MLAKNLKRLAEYQDQYTKNEVIQKSLFRKIRKLEQVTKNDYYSSLLECIPCEGVIEICHKYADLGFCLRHGYFPLALSECLGCSTLCADKNDGKRSNWHWYDLKNTTSSKKCLQLLHSEEDLVIMQHLDKIQITPYSYYDFEIVWISPYVLDSNLKLGITRHAKREQYILIIASDRDTDRDLQVPFTGKKLAEFNNAFITPICLHECINY